jgi:hypothetical protein
MSVINYDALCYGVFFVVASLFVLAYIGMWDGPRRTAGRPPAHPPGYKNIEKHKKQKPKKKGK